MKKIVYVLLTLLIISCGDMNKDNIVSIGGSTTATSIVDEMIIKYKKINKDIKVTYDAQGSSVGINGLFDGIYNMAISSRDLTEDEIANGAKEKAFATDALVFIVSKNINITNITEENLSKILNGTIINWKQLGGPNTNINLINRDSSSGTYASIKELILENEFKDPKKAEFRKDGIVVKSNGEIIEKVSITSGAIGYIGIGYLETAINKGLRPLSINGVYPTIDNIKNNKYKIKRDLTIITNGNNDNKNESEFINFMTSLDGQDIVEEEGFISIIDDSNNLTK